MVFEWRIYNFIENSSKKMRLDQTSQGQVEYFNYFSHVESILIGETQYAQHGEVSICFEHVASKNGQTLLFVMGLSFDRLAWDSRFLQPFIEKGMGIIRLDNRCSGGSTFVKNFGKSKFDLHDMAHDAIAVMDAVGVNQVHAIGVSLGGMIVQQMAIDFPNRVLSITNMMSGAHIHPFNLSVKSYLTFLRMGWSAAVSKGADEIEKYRAVTTGIWRVLDPKALDEQDLTWIHAISDYQLSHDQKIRPDSALHQLLAVLRSESRYEPLQHSSIPKLVIHGDADPLIQPKHSEDFVQQIPNSQLIVLKDMGHSIPKQYYDSIAAAIMNHVEPKTLDSRVM
jgi:pimeloyl-ACP methyl ester carboxylesterase